VPEDRSPPVPVAQAMQRHSGGWKASVPKETPSNATASVEPDAPQSRKRTAEEH